MLFLLPVSHKDPPRRLNLLIAVMGDSFEKVKADEAAVAMFEQAQVPAAL